MMGTWRGRKHIRHGNLLSKGGNLFYPLSWRVDERSLFVDVDLTATPFRADVEKAYHKGNLESLSRTWEVHALVMPCISKEWEDLLYGSAL
jgi:hypothetical protein